MTLSTTMADLLQLAEFESDMLTALAYEKLGLDGLDEHVHINRCYLCSFIRYGSGAFSQFKLC